MAVTPARIQMLRRLRPELADMPDAQIADMFGGGEPSTAQIDMGQLIPQAQTVTPAAPAPMQPTQLQAPEPTQQQLAPQAQGEMAKAMALQAAQQDMINQQIAANQARIQQAESGAEVPPEVQQILAQREARYAGEEAQLAEDRKGAVWDAIAKAGFKMAQSQSPYFASALAEGMQAGLEGYDAAKAKSAEKKARLQEQKESVVLDRYDALTKARAAAREQLMSGVKLTADTAALANATNENLLNLATTESKIRTSKAQAQVAETTAQYAPEMARANLAQIYAQTAASNRSGRGGGGDGLAEKIFLKQYDAQQEAEANLQSAIAEQDAAKYAAMADPENPELLGKMNAARIKAQAALARARSLGVRSAGGYGLRGGPAGQPAAKPAKRTGFSIVK